MEKSRITALVDGIFAVAMTLLVLDLKLPEGVKISNDAEVWRQLVELKSRFAIYVMSFIVLGVHWVGHHSLFHFVRKVDRGLLWLNLLFLLFITLLPFSTNLLSGQSPLRIPVALYGTNLLLPWLISLFQLRYLAHHPELSHEQFTPAWIAIVRLRMAITAVVIAASIAISFFNPSIALSAYWLLLVFHFLRWRRHHPPAVND